MIRRDRDRGCIRLDAATLEDLVDQLMSVADISTGTRNERLQSESERAGLLRNGRLADDVLPLFQTVAAPWAVCRLTVMGLGRARTHQSWLAPQTGVLVRDLGEGEYDLCGLGLAAVPSVVARLARLSPRRHRLAGPPMTLPTEVFAGVLSSGEPHAGGPLATALPPSALREAVAAGQWRTVTVEAEWAPGLFTEPLGPVRERLVLLDTDAGWSEIELAPKTTMLRPVAPSEVWPRLIAMAQLPPRVDLDGAYARATLGGSLAQG